MHSSISDSIIKTILYADIFDYPLTAYEVWKWCITHKKNITFSDIQKTLLKRKGNIQSKLSRILEERDGYYFLKSKKNIVDFRHNRIKFSEKKIKLAYKYTHILRFFPFIKLIGISGGLAVKNADENDDIDLFIIAESGYLWITRFICVLLLDILRVRRKPYSSRPNNLLCLNMFIDEFRMMISLPERDIFSAHEVMQMYPLWSRNNTFQKFLSLNLWVKKYIPNAIPSFISTNETKTKIPKKDRFLNPYILFNIICKELQIRYMKKKRTTELISEHILRFHPHDARIHILNEYRKRLRKYSFPTDLSTRNRNVRFLTI